MVTVDGTVQVDGAPLPEGAIVFYPLDAAATFSHGGVVKDGKYSARVSLGEKHVQIRSPRNLGKPPSLSGMPSEMMGDIVEETLPEKYNAKSELKCTVDGSKKPIDFNLTSK